MPIFDAHVHIFPDKIAEQTVVELGRKADIPFHYNGTRDGLLKSMQTAGIQGALNCPIATTPAQVDSINRWSASQNQWPIVSLGTIHPDTPHPENVLKKITAMGLPGIKLHPEYQQFHLLDTRMKPIWAACEQLHLPVVLHCGADLGFSPPYHSSPAEISALLTTHPNLILSAAHFGSWNMWQEVERLLLGCPLFMDISFCLGLLPDEKITQMIRTHGTHRILFGTDAPWRNQKEDLAHFFRLPFSPEEQEQILWNNAASLFRFT